MEEIVRKAKSRLNLLKLLRGTDWGQQKETFKSLVGSFTYAAPVWLPSDSQRFITQIQKI